MKHKLLSGLLLVSLITSAQVDVLRYVNPFIGTGGHGHTFPGATAPFGAVQVSPDSRMADWDGSSGYHYSDSLIYGFSQTHLSGTGIPDYCDVLLMPFVGEPSGDPAKYRSKFSHDKEEATAGYYRVHLQKDNITAELTASDRCGFHRYNYPALSTNRGVLLDLMHRDEVLESSFEKVSNHVVRGLRRSRSWAQDQHVYYYIYFDQPIQQIIYLQSKPVAGDALNDKKIKVAFLFANNARPINVSVGISGVDTAGARKNWEREARGRLFDQIKLATRAKWRQQLNKIEVKGGDDDKKTIFYTALYHTMIAPNLYTDVDGRYRGTDGKIHEAKDFTNYTVFSLWDTYRALHPLMTILEPARTRDWIHTFLNQYKNGGMLPVWEMGGNETFCMIGYHSVPVIFDAYQKGIRDFDLNLALEAMYSYAESNRFGLPHYRSLGYIPNDKEHESVSKTLEYAYDDWCIAELSKAAGKKAKADEYYGRAQYYKNLFDPSTKMFRGKLGAMWYAPFEPREINNFFTEGNAWQYAFAVQQDIQGLMKLHGGSDLFRKKLDQLFSAPSQTTGRDQADVTGLIGQYAHGNEPSHHMAYLYAWTSDYRKTKQLIDFICDSFYKNAPDGLIGNEDCGQMSAWYVFSAMGFYPVTPGTGQYVVGSPQFDEIIIHLDNGNQFKVRREDMREGEVTIDEKIGAKRFINHSEIIAGKKLGAFNRFKHVEVPRSEINAAPIVIAPFIYPTQSIFKDSVLVNFGTLSDGFNIRYQLDEDSAKKTKPRLFAKPFHISQSSTIRLFSEKDNLLHSQDYSHKFTKVPSGRFIKVLSEVHPLYPAGGDEALIDSVFGTQDWRTGHWQSYFGKDFEAIVELDSIQDIQYVGVHVLEDVSPWIIYPKELIVMGSMDGEEYRTIGNSKNDQTTVMGSKGMKEMGVKISGRYKFLKVRAVNGGTLPQGHESAGQPSHLFISEVIVK